MPETITIRAHVYRGDPATGDPSRYDSFNVAGPPGMRVLDAIRFIYHNHAQDLAFQYACRTARCGTCAVRVNGRPVLACQERAKDGMTVEPLAPFPVIRDLVVDRGELERRYISLGLVPERAVPHPHAPEYIDPATHRDVGLMGSCIGCMICVAGCPAVHDRPFDGPMLMLHLRRLSEHPADGAPRLQQALAGGLLECYGCDACTQLCPADLSPADAIRAFRKDVLLGGRSRTPGHISGSGSDQEPHRPSGTHDKSAVLGAAQVLRLPRDSTRQTEGLLYGALFQSLNRWTGLVIFAFLFVHLLGQGSLRIEALRPVLVGVPQIVTIQYVPWIRALLFSSIAFHFLQGFRLIILDMGGRLEYRQSFWTISGISLLVGLSEVVRHGLL